MPALSHEQLVADHRYFHDTASSSDITPTSAATQARLSELEDEVTKLRGQLAKAKGFNNAMWDSIVNLTMGSDGEDAQKRRKI